MRTVKSVKAELIKKAREAMLSAVQIYNNPQVVFKSESFITLAIIAWTYLLHAYFRNQRVDYHYFDCKGKKKIYSKTKYGARKTWELERCLQEKSCPCDEESKTNLRFLIGIRHEIEHQMTNKIDEYLSAKLQACALNFDFYLTQFFGARFSLGNQLSLTIQFSRLAAQQVEALQNNPRITSNVRNFAIEFEDGLSNNLLTSPRYSYKVLFVPISVNRKGQADQVIEFIKSDSPLAENLQKNYAVIKETEKAKYLPGGIVKQMQSEGYAKFTFSKHTELWKSKDAKNAKYNFGVYVAKTWYWYETWLKEVRKYCEDNAKDLKKPE